MTNDKAVFLSYASQDAEAARHICDALRAAGVEVWFDQSELRGGDAWDQKIRKQIKECALFVPIISANTQARQEGYFRLEWRLADQRTHLMSHDRAFLLPVTIDATTEQGARVPESFLAVQWTPVRDETDAGTFAARVRTLLQPEADASDLDATSTQSIPRRTGPATSANPAWRWPGVVVALALAVAGVSIAIWRPWQATPKGQAVSETRRLVLQARSLIDDDLMAVRENFRNAEELCQKAVALDNADGEAWATLARVSCGLIHRSYDTSPQRIEAARTQAQRALQLAPESIEARLAMAEYFAVTDNSAEAERRFRDLLQRTPQDSRMASGLAFVLGNLGRGDEARQIRLHHPSFGGRDPRPLMADALDLMREGRLGDAEAMVDRAQAIAPTATGFRYKLVILGLEHDNLPAAIAYLQTVPSAVFLEDAFASRAAQVYLRAEDGAKALEALRRIPRELFEDHGQTLPRGYLAGWALRMGGKHAAAEAEWRAALAAVEKRLTVDPNRTRWLYWKAILLAHLGQREEAEKTHRLEVELRGIAASHYSNGSLLLALGKTEESIRALETLRQEQRQTTVLHMVHGLRREPWFTPIRDDPRVQKLIADLGRAPAPPNPAGSAAARGPEKSVAVLAFENRSSEKDSEYFTDGISDELINVLGRVPGLRVVGRTSSYSFKDKRAPSSEIGRVLNVRHLVEGSVQRAGVKVRVIARLIQADTGDQVWGDSFEPDLKDVLAAQIDVAQSIARALSLRLGAASSEKKAVNPEALQLYLQGRQLWSLRLPATLDRAESLFQQALRIDPGLVQARIGLADVALVRDASANASDPATRLGNFADRDSSEIRRIIAEAEAALAQDPSLAEAHATIGLARSFAWDTPGALRSLHRAVELNPNYATAHLWLGRRFLSDGRMPEALAALERAVELDPLSPIILDNYALLLVFAGRPIEALPVIERALLIRPNHPQTIAWKIWAMTDLGRKEEALKLVTSVALTPDDGTNDNLAFAVPYALRKAGENRQAEAFARKLSGFRRFIATVGSGQTADAMPLFDVPSFHTLLTHYLLFLPALDSARNDPRFQSALGTLGLTEAHARAQAWRATNPPVNPGQPR